MELWASGFNAFGQLDFENNESLLPPDLKTFICVLKHERIELVWTTISATFVESPEGLDKIAGYTDPLIKLCVQKYIQPRTCAVAGNEKITEYRGNILKQYLSLDAYLSGVGDTLVGIGEIEQVKANETTFTVLSKTGEVWTWGDVRYEACLGREVTEENPAAKPGLVEDLTDLPTGRIRKISSGGYVTAALTEENDLYIWGGRPGEKKLLEDISGLPVPVDLNGHDVLDIAVGMNHMVALTTDHKVFVVGRGENGQLGLGVNNLGTWEEVSLPLIEHRIVGVHAGYKNSFLILENEKA